MLRKYLLVILIVCLTVTAAARAAADEVLPAGRLLQCTLDEPDFFVAYWAKSVTQCSAISVRWQFLGIRHTGFEGACQA